MKYFLLLTCYACLFLPVFGQNVSWLPGDRELSVGRNLQVLEDTAGTLRIDEVSSAAYSNQFRPSGQSVLHFGFTDKVVWLRMVIQNNTADSLVLSFQQSFLSEVILYYSDAAGRWQKLTSGYTIPLAQKPVLDHFQLFPVPRSSRPLFIRLRPLIHAIPVVLMTRDHWEMIAARQKMNYGIYVGILLFTVIVNLFLFATLKKRYFLNYSILIFFYLLTSALVMEGYAVYFFPDISLMFWYKIVPVLDMPALLFYCISFFELKKKYPKVYRLTLYSALCFCIYLLVLTYLPLLPVLLLNQVFALYVFVVGIYVGITVGKGGDKLGFYFAGFYTLWFLLIMVEAVYIQTGVPRHLFAVSYVSTAIFMEAFLLAFLLAKRFQWEKRDDQLRQFEMKSRMERMEQNFQQEMLTTRLEIQEETFNTISQEIHDNVGQFLSLSRIQVNIMDQQADKNPQIIAELKDNLGRAMTDLRNIAQSLNSYHIQNNSLEETVAAQLLQINRLGLTVIDLSVAGKERAVDSQRKLVLYRIIQESIQNAIKHAKASHVSILLDYSDVVFRVEITDNGIGFNSQAVLAQNAGLGLQNLISRATLIGGKAEIKSNPGVGTTIQITTPYI